ncbi:MAG TPA: choice-of-anchor D domain-containing protein, partial [Pirellulaceae bacterium]|nr:choice-of-anchor D domain-containing protein [Pirellulaceae bacterium]
MTSSMIRLHGYSWRFRVGVVLLIVSTYPAGVVGSEGGITLSKASLDFGPVALGATVTQKVTITNESDAALRISKINWTCGCIQGLMKDPQITAHSESELVVRTRPTKPGKQAGTLFLYDSRGQSYQLQVSVEGIPAITVKPEVLQFGAVVQGSAPEKPLIIQFTEPRTYAVERLHF